MESEKALQTGIRSSATRGELAKALAQAQSQMQSAELNAKNPFFKSSYADLPSIVKACRGPLTDNGLSVAQFPGRTDGGVMELTTILMHESGEWLESTLTMPLAKADPQGYGSAITYAKRYALAAIVGVVTGEDDDGHEASQPPAPKRHQPTDPPNKPPAPADNGNIDWRAKLEHGNQSLGTVCSAAANAIPTINDDKHALNVLKKHYNLPDGVDIKWEMGQRITQAGAVKMYDFINEHELFKAEAENE